MKRVIDANEPGKNPLRLQLGEHRFNRTTWTCERERTRTVERRDRNCRIMLFDESLRFFFAHSDREHFPLAARAILHEASTQGCDTGALFERQHTGNTSRS